MRAGSSTIFPTSVEDVWEAVTGDEGLSALFGARATIDARPGGRIEITDGSGSVAVAVIEDVERTRVLVFRWLPFVRFADGSVARRPQTRVTFTLEPVAEGARLSVEEAAMSRAVSA